MALAGTAVIVIYSFACSRSGAASKDTQTQLLVASAIQRDTFLERSPACLTKEQELGSCLLGPCVGLLTRLEQDRPGVNPNCDLTCRQQDAQHGGWGRWESVEGVWRMRGTLQEGAALNHAALRVNAAP